MLKMDIAQLAAPSYMDPPPPPAEASARFAKVGDTDEWITDRSLKRAAVTLARELHCLNGDGTRLNITSQRQYHEFFLLLL